MKLTLFESILFSGIIGLFGFLLWMSIRQPMPDASVLKAARSMTPDPIVSKGSMSWKCSNGDFYSFEVTTPSGESVGYVCQGLFLKGATPRY